MCEESLTSEQIPPPEQTAAQEDEEESDVDDDAPLKARKHTKRKKIIQDSDSEADSGKENQPPGVPANHQSSDSDADISPKASPRIKGQAKRKLSSSSSSSSDSDSTTKTSQPQSSQSNKRQDIRSNDHVLSAFGIGDPEALAASGSKVKALVDTSSSDDDVPLKTQPVRRRVKKAPVAKRKRASQEAKSSTMLDPDIFDANGSSSGSDNSTPEESEEEEPDNRLDPKFSGPAGKKASKARKKTPKTDEALKIYSEKQRMLREQDVTVPYYEPPKKSLREFLNDHAPKLLKNLRNPPDQVKASDSVTTKPKPSRPPRNIEPMDYLEEKEPTCKVETTQIEHLPGTTHQTQTLTLAADDNHSSDDDLPDILGGDKEKRQLHTQDSAQDSQQSAQSDQAGQDNSTPMDFTNLMLNKQCDNTITVKLESTEPTESQEDFSEITVRPKSTAQMSKREAKKEKLRKLLGDSVNLDIVPQLSCNADGIVNLDNEGTEQSPLEVFKKKFDKLVAHEKTADEAKPKKAQLRVLKDMDDGSQVELSMDACLTNTAEETSSSMNKLAVLKEILHTKLWAQREEQYKRKIEDQKLFNDEEEVEDDLPEEEIIDEMTDSEEEMEDDEEQERITPLEHERITPEVSDADESESEAPVDEKKEQLMRRVRAILNSDDEDEPVEKLQHEEAQPDTEAKDFNSFMSNTLDMLSAGETVSQFPPNECTQLPLSIEETQSGALNPEEESQQSTFDGNTTADMSDLLDENACDAACTISKLCDEKSQALGFTQAMFNTQAAEDEVLGLCSGAFTGFANNDKSSITTDEAKDNIQTDGHRVNNSSISAPVASGAASVTAPVITERAVKKQALHFSDEEDEDDEEEKTEEAGEKVGNESDLSLHQDGDDSMDHDNDDDDDELRELSVAGLVDEKKTVPLSEALNRKPDKQFRRKKMMADFVDEEAELSGSEASADELDIEEEEDVLDTEKGDKDNVGTEAELRQQVGKMHMKNLIDQDDRELMLMKEMLLPDGDLHDDGQRQRKFRWRNVIYSNETGGRGFSDDDGEGQGGENEDDPEVKEIHERLNAERLAREKWIREQKEKRIEELDKARARLQNTENDENIDTQKSTEDVPVIIKPRKKGFILNKSRQAIDRFKERHKHVKPEMSGPTSNKNMIFRAISKEQAEKQRSQVLGKVTAKSTND